MFIDDLIAHNHAFVEGQTPKPWPEAEVCSLAVVACFDPRLDALLRPALGLEAGQGFMLRTAGAVVGEDILRTLAVAIYLFEVRNVLVVGHRRCRMASFPTEDFIDAFQARGVDSQAFETNDLKTWARAISNPQQGVNNSLAAIAGAPFLPADLSLIGAVLDEENGQLEIVSQP
jgi:carbonic anhydrase